METLKFKIVNPNALAPEYAHEGDSGMDVRAVAGGMIAPMGRATVMVGIAAEIPEGYELQVRPRSGLASKAGVFAMFGTIDQGYRGEIGVTLYNFNHSAFVFHAGDRIAQLVLAPVPLLRIQIVDEISETERGTNGFGSTGVG